MFNLFSSNTVKDIIDSMPKWEFRSEPIFRLNDKDYSVQEYMNEFAKTRLENAQLKDQLEEVKTINYNLFKAVDEHKAEKEKLELRLVAHQKITEGASSSISELTKEVIGLRHLKKENVELMERVNEIDNDVIRDLQDQLFTLKNDYAVLKAKLRDYQDKFAESFSYNDMKKLQGKLDTANEEIKKLKKDIVDYVFDKDEEINELKKTQNWKETVETLKNIKTQGFEDYDPSDFEEQKHPMHPLHWGGYDGAASAYPEEYSKWLNEQKDKAIAEKKQKEAEFNAEELLKRVTEYAETTTENLEEKFDKGKDVLDYFNVKVTTHTIGEQEEKWQCPCSICKESKVSWEEAASDLALRVIKLEKQIEELTKEKQSSKWRL
jgi:chromosome segregation ATPase